MTKVGRKGGRGRLAVRGVLLAVLLPAAGLPLLFSPAAARTAAARAEEGTDVAGAVSLSVRERTEVLKGKVVLREVPNPGRKGRTYEAVGVLPGSLDEALAVVTDYRHYPEFMPRVSRTDVTDESETVSIIDLYLNLPLGMDKRYRLKYRVQKGADGFRVDWEKLPWPEVPPSQTVIDTSGHWLVERFAAGGLLALYNVYTDPGHVPLGLKGLARSLSKHEVPRVIERVRQRLRMLAAPDPRKD